MPRKYFLFLSIFRSVRTTTNITLPLVFMNYLSYQASLFVGRNVDIDFSTLLLNI